jgi:hypothetical protein
MLKSKVQKEARGNLQVRKAGLSRAFESGLCISTPRLLRHGSSQSLELPTASNSTYPLITFEHQLARLEGVFFKVFQSGGQHNPALLSGTPQLPPGQLRKLSGKALEVLVGSVNPKAISAGLLGVIAKRKKKLVIEVHVSEAKHSLDRGAKRD